MNENAAHFSSVSFFLDYFVLLTGKRATINNTERGRTKKLFYGLEKARRMLHSAINILQAIVLRIRDVFHIF